MSKGLFTAGLGWGIAVGVAAGTFLIAPHLNVESETVEEPSVAETQTEETPTTTESPADDFVAEHATDMVAGLLEQRPVLVLRQHSVKDDSAQQLNTLLEDSGAINAGEIILTEKFTDPESLDELESIAAATLPTGSQLTYEGFQPGEVLAAALLLDPETAEPIASSEDRALVLQSMREAGFIDYEDGTILPAQGVIILAGAEEESFALDIVGKSAVAFDAAGGVTVAAGHKDLAEKAPEMVATIDQAWGRVSVIDSLSQGMEG